MTVDSLRGKLLVASPLLREATFLRSVVVVLEHSDAGALGVVINRPGDAPLTDVVPAYAPLASEPAVVFAGGPVEPQAAIALGVISDEAAPSTGFRPVLPPLVTVDLEVDPDEFGGSLQQLRIFAGYAGWAGGQLEGEIAAGAWYVVNSHLQDPFGVQPTTLWSAVLRRQPWPLSAVATCPLDPTMN